MVYCQPGYWLFRNKIIQSLIPDRCLESTPNFRIINPFRNLGHVFIVDEWVVEQDRYASRSKGMR